MTEYLEMRAIKTFKLATNAVRSKWTKNERKLQLNGLEKKEGNISGKWEYFVYQSLTNIIQSEHIYMCVGFFNVGFL